MAISEQNPFSQDMKQPNSPRKGWFCTKVVIPIATGLVGVAAILGLLYILVAFMANDPLGFGNFTFENGIRSPGFSTKVFLNNTQRSIDVWTSPSTTSLEVSTESETEPTSTGNWTTSDAFWFTTIPTSTFATTDASTVPTETIPTAAPSTMTPVPTTFGQDTDPSTATDPTSMVTEYVPEMAPTPEPPSWSYRKWPEDEYNRPHYMGRAKWYQCTPKWLPMQDFLDKQWMCQRCEQDAIDGIYKMDYELKHYDFFCYMMCFINSIFEQCAIHLNQTKPRSSPHSVRDCRFCNDLEEHRITRRN